MWRVMICLILTLSCSSASIAQDWSYVAEPLQDSSFPVLSKRADKTESNCTSWLFNVEDGYVLTGEHCINNIVSVTVNGLNAEVIKENEILDMAVLHVKHINGTSLVLRPDPITAGIQVATMGYPLGVNAPSVFRVGWIASPHVKIGSWEGTMFDVDIQQGHSGGAIVDGNGKVVSMFLRYRLDGTRQALAAGPTTRAIFNFIKEYLPS